MCKYYSPVALWILIYIACSLGYDLFLKKQWPQWYQKARHNSWGSFEDKFIRGAPAVFLSLALTFFISLFLCR